MRINEIKVGALLSYLQMGLAIVVSLIYTPLMIRILGKSEYGLYNAVASTISMLSILSLGFNSSYIRFYSRFKKNGDSEGVDRLNGLFLLVFLVIGAVAFLCGFFLTNNINIVFENGLNDAEYSLAKSLMILLTVNLTVSFPMSVFANIISAHEKFVFLKSLLILKTVFSPLLSIPLLYMGFGSVGIVIVTLAISVITDICFMLYCFIRLKVSFKFSKFDKGLFKELFVFTSFIAINLVVDQVNLNVDKILLGRFKGTESVAIYSVGYTLYTYFQQFSVSVSSVFTPRVHDLVNNYSGAEQKRRLTELFTKVGRIQFLILSLICTGFIFFGMPFITKIWAGPGYEDSYYVMLLLSVPSMIALTQNIGIEIQRAENRHKFRSIAYLAMAFLNVILSVFLCQKYGPVGSAIGTAISLVLANGILINVYYHKRCNIDVLVFWRNIFRMSFGLIIPCVCGFLINRYAPLDNVLLLGFFIIIYSLVYFICMWVISLNSFEKELLLNPFRKIFKRRIDADSC